MNLLFILFLSLFSFLVWILYITPRLNPLKTLAGPPLRRLLGSHLQPILDPAKSPAIHERFVEKYGRSVRIRGVGPWDDRLLTLDPISVSHVLKNHTMYEKPWQSRKLITNLIGCGMLSAEGQMHKRQRRVATPAFSIQNLRALVPVVYRKGTELKDKWTSMLDDQGTAVLDVCHWVSRATFDVIGLAGFDYEFNAIQNETNELFSAYKDMFEAAISQGSLLPTIISLYLPIVNWLFPDETVKTVRRCQAVIKRVAGELIQEKKRKILEGSVGGRDLLTLLLKSNLATDLPESQRISDEDILHNVNTFMFAGSDTSSLSVTWTLLLLAQNPSIQIRLREELMTVRAGANLTEDEVLSLHENISNLPFLNNVARESLRLIPPVHSSIRVATAVDVIPTKYPIHRRDGTQDHSGVKISKGSFVHVAIEAFNLDKAVWGEDAWDFNPDRWDKLSELAQEQPGLFSNTLTFSAGPRSCIGMRFSMIEIKLFLYVLLTNFEFIAEEEILRANVVLTRPYIVGRYKEGSQLPLRVRQITIT